MKKQLKNVMLLAAIAGSLSLTSCRETNTNNEEPAPPVQNEMHEGHRTDDVMGTEEQASAEFKNETTAAVYNHYLAIKSALVETDAALARQHAEQMVAELEGSDLKEEVLQGAREIAGSTEVNKQREAFSRLTASMESVLEGSLASGEIYKQFCPMAFEGKGDYWYSNSREIRNPYYGEKMLKCGRVEETIQ